MIFFVFLVNFKLLFTHHYPETYKPKFHCRRQSGMNFGYVTVNSNYIFTCDRYDVVI